MEWAGWIAVSYKVIRKASWVRWPERSKEDSRYLERVLGSEKNKYNGPETDAYLLHLSNSKEVKGSIADEREGNERGAEWMRRRMVEKEVRGGAVGPGHIVPHNQS